MDDPVKNLNPESWPTFEACRQLEKLIFHRLVLENPLVCLVYIENRLFFLIF